MNIIIRKLKIKRIFMMISLIFILFSCSYENEEKVEDTEKTEICKNSYKIWKIDKTNLKLKWVVVSDDTKNVSSPSSGTVTYLNCKAWKTVYSKTLIAKITPDYNNPTIANLSIQKSSLVSQRANIESLKTTTLNNLDNQISDLKSQINLLKNNIELTKKSGNLSKLDLEKQIETLENSTKSLETNLYLLKSSKSDALEKIEISKKTNYTNIKNLVADNLLKIDEIFWITLENRDLNNKYENYLGKKNSLLLNDVQNKFRKLNIQKFELMSNLEISNFLWELIDLNEKVQKSIKYSIPNIYFPQTKIDSFYIIFLNYSKNINDLKNAWDSIGNLLETTNKNFETKISSSENQIKTNKTNLENLQTNRIWSIDTANELQLANLDSQLKTSNTNLNNLISNKKTQIISLDNQILQLNQFISSLDSSLVVRNVYAWINWIIKQKSSSKWNTVWPWMSLCQIIPNAKSTKIKIYSPIELSIWDKLIFDFNWEKYEIIIENALIYKDAATQNYVYESNYLDRKYFKDWEIISLDIEKTSPQPSPLKEIEQIIINIPVSYVKNKIDWNYIKILSWSLLIDKKVELWDINWNMVEIESGAEGIENICK